MTRPFSVVQRLALLGLALLAPATAIAVAPHAGDCVVQRTLGVPCPGCGLGRSLVALGRGQLGAAIALYPPLVALALGYLAALGALSVGWLRDGRSGGSSRMAAGLGVIIAVFVLGNWVVQLARWAA